jgi:hypothetical protein
MNEIHSQSLNTIVNEESNKRKGRYSHGYFIQNHKDYTLDGFKVKGFAIFFRSRGCVSFNPILHTM